MYGFPMRSLQSGRVLFGTFELDLRTGELRSTEAPDPDTKVLLREQVFQVLRMLLEREGKIVTREEIKGRLWPNDTVVDFDQGINHLSASKQIPLHELLGISAQNCDGLQAAHDKRNHSPRHQAGQYLPVQVRHGENTGLRIGEAGR